jgi:hypothetical protein
MKCVRQMGFNNHNKQNEGCEEDMELNPVTCCLPANVQKGLVEDCSGDGNLTVHEEVPSTL